MNALSKYQPQMLGLLRIATALTFMEHGTQKLFGFPAMGGMGGGPGGGGGGPGGAGGMPGFMGTLMLIAGISKPSAVSRSSSAFSPGRSPSSSPANAR